MTDAAMNSVTVWAPLTPRGGANTAALHLPAHNHLFPGTRRFPDSQPYIQGEDGAARVKYGS